MAISPSNGKHPITTDRAARLYKLLTILADGPQRRESLLKKLKINPRGFYRELELLRARGISVDPVGTKYHLVGDLDSALAKLPVPNLQLNVREALTLAKGPTAAHRKLQSQLNTLLGTSRNGY